MAFNRWTYYANKYERQAREYIVFAREAKQRGDLERVAEYVRLARTTWTLAQDHRAAGR
jgi:hypothetical protein